MLRISKNGTEKLVTVGAYEDLYKGLGYEILSGNEVGKDATEEKKSVVSNQPTSDELKDKQSNKDVQDEKSTLKNSKKD